MLSYEFMQRALLVGLMLSIIIPMIGIVMVNRRTSMIGDALSHTALSGVALGLIIGINPVFSSIIICIIAGFAIEIIRKKFKNFGDMATAIIMSLGIGLAAIMSDFTPGGTSFESFLFGSITSVTKTDLIVVSVIFVFVLFFSLYLYYPLLYNSISPLMVNLAGINSKLVSNIFTFLTAVTIGISTKTVGALMISSLMVLPVASSLLISKSYRETFIKSIIIAIIYMMAGISASFYLGIKPGGAIVVIAVIGMIISLIIQKILKR